MKCECKCIKNMEWGKSYEHYIHLRQKTTPTLLLQIMVYCINKTMKQMTCDPRTINTDSKNNNNWSYNYEFYYSHVKFETIVLVKTEQL